MWPVLAFAGGSMLLNEMNNRETRRQNAAQGAAAAAQTQFSPWTKMGKGSYQHQAEKSTLGAGAQGALTGLSMQQQFNQADMNAKLGEQQLQMNQMKMNQMSPQYTDYSMQNKAGYDTFNPWAKQNMTGSMVG